jgi:hypothetical protein
MAAGAAGKNFFVTHTCVDVMLMCTPICWGVRYGGQGYGSGGYGNQGYGSGYFEQVGLLCFVLLSCFAA